MSALPSARGRMLSFFATFRARLVDEAAADPEPEIRFTEEWYCWQRREWYRRLRWIELAESEALTTHPADPAPLASEGLKPFLEWARRQQARRSIREKARTKA